jgi:hypothetical protein
MPVSAQPHRHRSKYTHQLQSFSRRLIVVSRALGPTFFITDSGLVIGQIEPHASQNNGRFREVLAGVFDDFGAVALRIEKVE